MCFPSNILSCIIRLQFRIVDLVIFVFNFGFLSLHVRKLLSTLLFDFSANLNMNQVIFYSMNLSLSFLFKSIKILNFSPQFIILFD